MANAPVATPSTLPAMMPANAVQGLYPEMLDHEPATHSPQMATSTRYFSSCIARCSFGGRSGFLTPMPSFLRTGENKANRASPSVPNAQA